MTETRPGQRPKSPYFSSGPCAKHPGHALGKLNSALLGRSHRSPAGRAALRLAVEKTRELLKVPQNYRIAITPASDTGAFEMAMWSLLGPRGVDVLAWEAFGREWVTDIARELRIPKTRVLEAPYGALPDLGRTDFDNDVVFTWNGTASGVRVPNGEWISANRGGLTLCDATSACFAQELDWSKLDVATFSWQKVLGGEAQHGMLILSPRAVERLETHQPSWPIPKVFRLTKGGELDAAIFEGTTINTPSMLCVADYLDALAWVESIGGLAATIARSDANFQVIADWVAASSWAAFLASDPKTRSNTSVCLRIADADFGTIGAQAAIAKEIVRQLESEGVAYDIGAYRDAPPGLRIWAGATVETGDLAALLPWLDWAFAKAKPALIEAYREG
jgi:phosphoserine aminotransferase